MKQPIQYEVELRGARYGCQTCLKVFKSCGAFDRHRKGKYHPYKRRCLTTDEMLAAGFVKKETGVWVSAAMPERLAGNRRDAT